MVDVSMNVMGESFHNADIYQITATFTLNTSQFYMLALTQ